jgi:hypothetical protein
MSLYENQFALDIKVEIGGAKEDGEARVGKY